MQDTNPSTAILSLSRMARRLGVAQRWLREQAEADAIPCVKAGRRFLFVPEIVERAIVEEASQAVCQEDEDA